MKNNDIQYYDSPNQNQDIEYYDSPNLDNNSAKESSPPNMINTVIGNLPSDIQKQANILGAPSPGYDEFTQAVRNALKRAGLQGVQNILKGADSMMGSQYAPQLQQQINASDESPSTAQGKTGKFVGEALPFAITHMAMPEANWIQRALAQGATGGMTSSYPLGGMALGAGAELGGTALTSALKKALSYVSTTALPQRAKDFWNMTKFWMPISNEQAYQRAARNETADRKASDITWDTLRNKAKMYDDDIENVDISNDHYRNKLQEKIDDLSELAPHIPSEELNQSIKTLQYLKDESPTNSFSDMINHVKALNSNWKKSTTLEFNPPQDIINHARKAMMENIQKNIDDNGLQESLGDLYADARQSTHDLHDTYHEIADSKGNKTSSEFYGWQDNATPGNFVRQYLPTTADTGTANMERLGKMLGDDDLAKRLIKQNLFADVKSESEAVTKFNNMSNEQQKWLFETPEMKYMDSLSDALTKDKKIYKEPTNTAKIGRLAKALSISSVPAYTQQRLDNK